jgi:hypothetical protein
MGVKLKVSAFKDRIVECITEFLQSYLATLHENLGSHGGENVGVGFLGSHAMWICS